MPLVMIIDDSETLRFGLRADLEKAGYTVIEAVDGADGFSKLEANPAVDLLISDLNMPRVDGLAMCKQIQDSGKYPNLPIFMLTTDVSTELKETGKKVGVKVWIRKPFQSERLIAVVKKLLPIA